MLTYAKDLTKQEPRPKSDSLGGYLGLPRLIDKARAFRADTLGDYIYPCSLNKKTLAKLKIDSDKFADIATRCRSDEEILKVLRKIGLAR